MNLIYGSRGAHGEAQVMGRVAPPGRTVDPFDSGTSRIGPGSTPGAIHFDSVAELADAARTRARDSGALRLPVGVQISPESTTSLYGDGATRKGALEGHVFFDRLTSKHPHPFLSLNGDAMRATVWGHTFRKENGAVSLLPIPC